MSLWVLFITAIGLSMDAFAVSICKGLAVKKVKFKYAIIVGLYFGGFQALMPLVGYTLGVQFKDLIENIDHWIAFILLAIIGFNMIKEAKCEDENINNSFSFKTMLPLAVATSIDALAVGVTYAFLSVDIIPAVSFIGIITFLLSIVGLIFGNFFGCKYKSRAEIFGGIVLIAIGVKILLEHLRIFG